MSTKQISAVEWLVNELKTSKHYQRVINEVNQSSTQIKDVIEQAKAMGRQEIIETFKHAQVLHKMNDEMRGEQYYNETYKQD